MKRLLCALLLCVSQTSHSQTGAVADCLTTFAGVGAGMVELNPLGPVLTCALKAPLMANATPAEREQMDAVWGGVAISNLAGLVGIAIGPFLGVLIAGMTWGAHSEERQFNRICEAEQAKNPALKCVYKKA